MKDLSNDPRLTAYALGELSPEESKEIEGLIGADPELLAFVRETQALAGQLEAEFGGEALPRLAPAEREKLIPKEKRAWFLPSVPQFAALLVVGVILAYWTVEQTDLKRLTQRSSVSDLAMSEEVEILEPIQAPSAPPMKKAAGKSQASSGAEPQAEGDSGARMRTGSTQRALRMVESAKISGLGLGGAALRKGGSQLGFAPGEVAHHTESYDHLEESGFRRVKEHPLSTFAVDVDTASYANVRRFLQNGQLPPKDAVRIEELVNYFPYGYEPPKGKDPFSVHAEMAKTPWNDNHNLLRVALKGKEVSLDKAPRSNLVFLLDVSGSMMEPSKLPLVKKSLSLLVEKLQEKDRVALVVYAGSTGLVLPSTTGDDKAKILAALEKLEAGGSTNGGAGIELAYKIAQENFIPGGVNRVILATDGDFNVGISSEGALVRLIQEKARTGVFLSVLGFGTGNLKDSQMEKLANKGNGNYAYIDSLLEAKKALVEEAGGTLVTIAKDVKIQVEFNPAYVEAYRLIGYENRLLKKEDFNDDSKDAGEIGAGHTVTALYEIVPAGGQVPGSAPPVDPSKYGSWGVEEPFGKSSGPAGVKNGEALTVKVRWKAPEADTSQKLELPVKNEVTAFASAGSDFQFAAAVAAFGMLLRDSDHKGNAHYRIVATVAEKNKKVGGKESPYRSEFVELVKKAELLSRQKR